MIASIMKLAFSAAVISACEWLASRYPWDNPKIAVLMLYVVGSIFFLCFEWPSSEWLFNRRLTATKKRLGNIALPTLTQEAKVKDLQPLGDVTSYFSVVLNETYSERICNDINAQLPLRIMGFGFAMLLYIILRPSTIDGPVSVGFLEWAGIVIASLPYIADVNHYNKQRLRNKEFR